ncbi:MAG: acetate--CoA ligase family protein [Vicinamibacterales bacterium]
MTADWAYVEEIVGRARRSGRTVMLEPEGLAMLGALGIDTPPHIFLRNPGEVDAACFEKLGGDRVVVKVVSPEILHKSDVGGVRIAERSLEAVRTVISQMVRNLAGRRIEGFTISAFVPHERSLGHELLLGLRWTADFGPIVTLGPGGIYTEFLAANLREGKDVAIFPARTDWEVASEAWAEALDEAAVTSLVTKSRRGQPPAVEPGTVLRAVGTFASLAARFTPHAIAECEINPIVVSEGRLVALDILVKLGAGERPSQEPPRPIYKLKHLLEPRSAAVVGVSEKLNPGHIILNNLIRDGFDRSRITVVKPGTGSIEGCRAVPDIRSVPGRVDMFVLSISAAQSPEAIAEIVEGRKAESLIVIPGGLEEKDGTEAIVTRMRAALRSARQSEWQGPLINGGNCLGIRSRPGRYDTMFIPEVKLPAPAGPPSPVAIVSQSGAFAITQLSKLARLNAKYVISVGNQMDLTVGDYLDYLKDDPEIDVFAVYVEGFKQLDGQRFLAAARHVADRGGTVVLYRAGRTPAGAQASRSHTASIAGDYAVTRALARSGGVVLAESLRDFADLTALFAALGRRPPAGWNLGAVSNAGFECVAIADNIGRFALPRFAPTTTEALAQMFRDARIDSVVDVHNPVDLTPMANDATYEAVVRAVLSDPGVHVGVVGCVPLTPALNTLPAGQGHNEDLSRPDGIVSRLMKLKDETAKPWVAVVDAGAPYDAMAERLEAGNIPTFREADRALRLLNVFVAARLARR